jgi:hypothetical protein
VSSANGRNENFFNLRVNMKLSKIKFLLISVFVAQSTMFSVAQSHLSASATKGVERHRIVAAAHEAAARCLEAGKDVVVCQKELQLACKGLAIGSYCGLKHEH